MVLFCQKGSKIKNIKKGPKEHAFLIITMITGIGFQPTNGSSQAKADGGRSSRGCKMWESNEPFEIYKKVVKFFESYKCLIIPEKK